MQGFDIWITLLLARMLNKTAKYRVCLPYDMPVEFDQQIHTRFDRMPMIVAQNNANLGQIECNTTICGKLKPDSSHVHANCYTRPKHYADLYPIWRVDFAILVPNWKAPNIDMNVVIIFLSFYCIYAWVVAIIRRLAQNLTPKVRCSHTMQSFYFDAYRTLLGLAAEIRLANRVDRFMLMFTTLLAMLVASTVSLYFFKMQLLSVRYTFNTVGDVISSQLPIYAQNFHIGVPIMRWRQNVSHIRYSSLPEIMQLMHEDVGEVAIIWPTESFVFIQRNYGIRVNNWRLLTVPMGHRFKSYSLAIGAIRLADRLKIGLMRASELGFELFYSRCNERLPYKEWLKDKQVLEREAENRGQSNVGSFLNVCIGGNCIAFFVFVCECLQNIRLRTITNRLYLRFRLYM